ncbi:hypothetical protein QQ045_014751 [Rhodiola kirilowii]
MEKPSCLWSHWWQGSVYFTISAMLAFLAITAAFRASASSNTAASVEHISPHLSHNASLILRNSGFGIFATMMQLSPELFCSSSSNYSTVFAVRDSAIHSLSPLMLRDLIKFQTVPENLTVDRISKKPEKTCLETLLHFKNVSITRNRKVAKKRLIEINHVQISIPNLILEEQVTVHGVASPFAPLEQLKDFSSMPNPNCDLMKSKHVGVQWTKLVHSLHSKRFTAFARALQSVHPILIKDYSNLTSVTVFAPPNLSGSAAGNVKVHILPRKLTYGEIDSLHDGTSLKTLDSAREVVVTGRGNNNSRRLRVGGVEITGWNVIKNRDFIVHSVARAFEIDELHHSS